MDRSRRTVFLLKTLRIQRSTDAGFQRRVFGECFTAGSYWDRKSGIPGIWNCREKIVHSLNHKPIRFLNDRFQSDSCNYL